MRGLLAGIAVLALAGPVAAQTAGGDEAVCYVTVHAGVRERVAACGRLIRSLGRDSAAAARPYGARALHYVDARAFVEAWQDAEHSTKLDPKEPLGYVARAEVARSRGRLDLAQPELEEAAALRPEYYTFYSRGRIRQALGDLAGAAADFSRANEIQPTWSPALVARGNIHWSLGDKQKALADYEAARKVDPASSVIIDNQATTLQELGRTGDALAVIDEAIARSPKDANLFVARARVHVLADRNEQAVADFKRALALEPRLVRAWSALGDAYGTLGRYDEAMDAFGRALRLSPNDPLALNGRCWVRAIANRDLAAAYADCNRSVELEENASYLDSRGFVRFRSGDYQGALADFEAALAKAPGMAASLFMRGVIRARDGRTAEGQADIARAEQISPGITQRYARYGVSL